MDTIKKIEQQIAENTILLYMKGSAKLPNCGFSAQAVQVLNACEVPFISIDVLENPDIRSALPKFADWPTFPQLWVAGEFIGGCDIMVELFQNGELKPLLESALKPPIKTTKE